MPFSSIYLDLITDREVSKCLRKTKLCLSKPPTEFALCLSWIVKVRALNPIRSSGMWGMIRNGSKNSKLMKATVSYKKALRSTYISKLKTWIGHLQNTVMLTKYWCSCRKYIILSLHITLKLVMNTKRNEPSTLTSPTKFKIWRI